MRTKSMWRSNASATWRDHVSRSASSVSEPGGGLLSRGSTASVDRADLLFAQKLIFSTSSVSSDRLYRGQWGRNKRSSMPNIARIASQVVDVRAYIAKHRRLVDPLVLNDEEEADDARESADIVDVPPLLPSLSSDISKGVFAGEWVSDAVTMVATALAETLVPPRRSQREPAPAIGSAAGGIVVPPPPPGIPPAPPAGPPN